MTTTTNKQIDARLEAAFGTGRGWTSQSGSSATTWETSAFHLLWADGQASEAELRRLWEARKGRQAYAVVVLAPADDLSKLRVAGPQDARPVRELPAGRVLDLLEKTRNLAAREAASLLSREFSRLEEAVVPGLRVKDLLTPHFLRERLRRPINEERLSRAAEALTLDKRRKGPFVVIEFDTPANIEAPTEGSAGFVGGGFTADGAREFVIPNLRFSDLVNATIRLVN